MKKKMETKKKFYIGKFNAWTFVLTCYMELLRLYHFDREKLTDFHIKMGAEIQNFIKSMYEYFKEEYLDHCKKGDTSWVRIIVDAIGNYAFSENWFCEGLGVLYCTSKKEIKIPRFKEEIDYSEIYNELYKFEKRRKKKGLNEALSFYDNPSKIKTQYFRDFPVKATIALFHTCYGLLYFEKAIIADTDRTISELGQKYRQEYRRVMEKLDKNLEDCREIIEKYPPQKNKHLKMNFYF